MLGIRQNASGHGCVPKGWVVMLLKRNGLQKSSESADREKRLGNLGGYTGGNFAYQVFHPDGLSPALLNMGNGGGQDATYCCEL